MSNATKSDWQAERVEMAADVRRNILDPFALVAMWMGNQNKAESIPDYQDIGRLLSLLVMGAHNELDMLCSANGGHMNPPLTDILEGELKRQWTGEGVKS